VKGAQVSFQTQNASAGAASRSRSSWHVGWALLNTLQTIAMAAWSVFWITVSMVVMVVTLRRDMPLVMARRIWAPGMLAIAGARLVVDGARIDWSKPHIFVMNHQSALDIPAAFVGLRTNLRFIAKKELAWVPFLGWYMLATGMVFVDRGNRARAVVSLERAGRRIREGASIIAYPEGTRSRDGYIRPFKKGVFAVALEAGVPIVPVAVQGSRDVLPSNRFSMRPGTVHVRIGEPIETVPHRGGGRDALIERVHACIVEQNLRLGGVGSAPSS
jgi:1-acyl-sn-glycerol-3-phosphate acyltransferase